MTMNDLTFYHREIAPQVENWDLFTYRTHGVVSSIIHYWSPDNHASGGLRLPQYDGLKNRRWTLEALGGGVKMSLLSKVLEKVNGQVYWHQLKPEFKDMRDEAACWGLEQVGTTRYDFKALLQMAFGWVSPDAAKLVCSEYWYFGAVLAKMIAEQDKIPTPSDLPKLGLTLPPILIVESEPVVWQPVTP